MSPEGDPQDDGDTVLPGKGDMDPSIIRGDMVGYDGLVGVPPSPIYNPYGQPLTPYVFGHGHVSPRDFGLEASLINPSSCPRFLRSPGQFPYGSQPYPIGFNPQVPWVPPMGFPRGPPPRFPPQYSQVFSVKGAPVNIPDGRGYGTGEGYISPDSLSIPGEPQNMIPDEVVPEEPDQDPVVPGDDVVPKEPERDPVPLEEDIEVPDKDGQGQIGTVPDEGESMDPEEPERDPAPEGDEGENPGNGNPNNVEPINPDDPRVEIETLHQQLSQTRATLAKSVQVLQKRTAQDIQIKNLRELMEKQQGQFDSKTLELQTIEKE